MKFYSCCSDTRCDNHQAALRFLRQWGIRPTLGHDDDGYYFEFDLSRGWPRNKRRRFEAALRKRTTPKSHPMPEPDPSEYPCAHCHAAPGTCLVDCPCGHWLPTCTGCLAPGRRSPCPACGVVPTPRLWPAPQPGPREDRVRTFRSLYRGHLSALVGCGRWCRGQRVVAEDGRDCGGSGLAVGYLGLVATRLYHLEKAWIGEGIGVNDLAPALNANELALRLAACVLGMFVERPHGPAEAMDPLLLALLRATEPFQARSETYPRAAVEMDGDEL